MFSVACDKARQCWNTLLKRCWPLNQSLPLYTHDPAHLFPLLFTQKKLTVKKCTEIQDVDTLAGHLMNHKTAQAHATTFR